MSLLAYSRVMTKSLLAGGSVLALLCFGCVPENQGLIEAEETGDLSNPLAVRGDRVAELTAACGDVAHAVSADLIRRKPYLQNVGATGGSVLWAGYSTRGSSLEITTPDGDVVTSVEADLDTAWISGGMDRMVARFDGLQPNQVYCYSVLDPAGGTLIGRVGFKTAPTRGGPVSFTVLGDTGDASPDQIELAKQLAKYPADLMLHVGDMAYGSGTISEFDEKYFSIYGSLLSHVPMFPVTGNHEYGSDDAKPFRALFDLPNNERWYSFDWGNVHFIGLDTEQLGDEQEAWLANDLKNSTAEWRVAFMHKGPYSSGGHGSNSDVQERFQPLFEQFGVELVFSGHDHHYERTKQINGVHYVITGGGGAGTNPVSESEFTAFATEVVQLTHVTVDDTTLRMHAIDGTGKEFDQLVLEH